MSEDMPGWRYRCPDGHVTTKTVGKHPHSSVEKGFRCTTCRLYGDGAEIEYIEDVKTGTRKYP